MNAKIRLIKKGCVLTGLLLSTVTVYAQDVLTKKNGDEIEVKVIKISTNEIEYKKWSNQDGPSYTLLKNEVFMIKYNNGEKEVFNENSSSLQNQPTNNAPIKVVPSNDNASLIEKYNKMEHRFYGFKVKAKKSNCWFGTLGVTQSSILSTDEIEINLSQEKKSYPYYAYNYDGNVIKGVYGEKYMSFRGKYFVEIGALGVGGVANTLAGGTNVGGGSQSSVSTTYSDQRVVAIPPHGKMVLSKDEAIPVKTSKAFCYDQYKMNSFSEDFKNREIPDLQCGEYKIFSEKTLLLVKGI